MASVNFGLYLPTYSFTPPPLLSKTFQAIKKSFYEQSIFFAANNEAIAEKALQYKNLSWTQKIKIGAAHGCKNILFSSLISITLDFLFVSIPTGKPRSTEPSSLSSSLTSAVIEEIFFRGVIQNCLAGTQKITNYLAPKCLQNTRIFKWIVSPSARIISINLIFAGLHLLNGGSYLSQKDSFIQATLILLQPVEGILHETTGNIIAPIIFHMTNNYLAIRLLS